jgi:hypothetical protein
MSPAEIKALASAKIVLLDNLLVGANLPELHISPVNTPDDKRAQQLMKRADRMMNREILHDVPFKNRLNRVRALLAMYISA